MFSQDKTIEKLEMWLAVQYWQVYYNDYEERNRDREEDKGENKKKRVSFNEVNDVVEIQTEHQIYLMMEQIRRNQILEKLKS